MPQPAIGIELDMFVSSDKRWWPKQLKIKTISSPIISQTTASSHDRKYMMDGWMDEWMARRWKEPALVAAIKVPTYPVRIHLIQFRCLLWRQKVSLSLSRKYSIPFMWPAAKVRRALRHTHSLPACLPLCWETCMHSITSHVCPHVVLGIHNCRLETKADGIFGCFNGWARAGFRQWPFWNMSTWRTEWLYRTIMNGPSVGTANNVNNY